MKKNVLSQVLSYGLILTSLTLQAGCQSSPTVESADTVVSEAETPSTSDPADRKFFTPGYGVNAGGYGETETPSNIDPADRKFFTPGYGVNAGGNDLTAYHQSEWDRTPNTVLRVEENALAVYHQSEWDRTPNTVLSIEENALAVYHQSEWDRTPNTVLSVEDLSKIDPADRKFFIAGYGAYVTPKERK